MPNFETLRIKAIKISLKLCNFESRILGGLFYFQCLKYKAYI